MNLNNEHSASKEILLAIKLKNNFKTSLFSVNEKEYFVTNYDKIEILIKNFNNICFIKKK